MLGPDEDADHIEPATPHGHYSVAFPRQWWYPACRSSELGGAAPLGIEIMDEPVVLFRDRLGRAHALVDRCPHRNVPLSAGRVTSDGHLECGYHGWCFEGGGRCTDVPGLIDPPATPSTVRDVDTYPVTERDGFVWIWPDRDTPPHREPFALPTFDDTGHGEVVFRFDLDCTVHASLENALDVPHTAFLHRGLFRGGNQRELTAVRTDIPDGVEVQYLGEPVGFGTRRLGQGAPLTFDHWDRFVLPSIAQVEYRVRNHLRIVNTIAHLPLSPFRTRAWFVVRYHTPLPTGLARPIVWARGRQIARQDVEMLEQQTANTRRFGGERYTSTALDLIGAAIWRLMRQAERAEQAAEPGTPAPPPHRAEPSEVAVTFRV